VVSSTNTNPSSHGHAAWRAAVDDEDEHHHLTTVEGWRRFVADAPRPPELLATSRWERLDGADRLADYEARLDYHTRLGVVATSALRQVVHTGRRLMLLNRHAISARRGLIVSGRRAPERPPRSPSSARPTS